ncbi:MAG: hypothetical protein JNK85_11290 [Verrucomicrobiales bacterium]|nr:hypothetical protein [Verrucomicrobiales bacterium]
MTPRLNKMPFWFADATLLAAAAVLVAVGGRPLKAWEMIAVVACVAIGGWLAVLPFLKEYEADVKLAETGSLDRTMEKLTQLDTVADRIAGATGQWQGVQDRAAQTAEMAKGVVERLAREAESFAVAVSRTSDAERQKLKLEVDKLRRAEGEWLQAIGRIMDHVFALHVAAVRSGQPALAEQIDRFHGACRDALRKVGFVPVVAAPDEVYDPRRHQVADGSRPTEGARVDETVAPGFVFQGQMIRPIIVKVVDGDSSAVAGPATPRAEGVVDPDSPPSTGRVYSQSIPSVATDSGHPNPETDLGSA